MKEKVLILGASGMLGSMVLDYFLKHTKHEAKGTVRDFDFPGAEKVKKHLIIFDGGGSGSSLQGVLDDFKPDYIINCIGIIKPYCKDDDEKGVLNAIRINALFPHELSLAAEKTGARIIQIATDCVWSGEKGNYTESDPHDARDVYGKTKSLGEVFRKNILNIRCSIIGPELKGRLSLLEWFLAQPEQAKLKGFSHHAWNGVTTLQFARLCADIISRGKDGFDASRAVSHIHHYVPNATVNKFELLGIFSEVFAKEHALENVSNIGAPVDRTIATKFHNILPPEQTGKKDMRAAIAELAEYMRAEYFKEQV